MRDLKEIDYTILLELMKNSKISDRQLARKIGVSQPTVTRRRSKLEKTVIDDYTVIPNWVKLGYGIFAMTFVKINPKIRKRDEVEALRNRGSSWLESQSNVIMSGGCQGDGVDAFTLSFHKSYVEYDSFIRNLKLEMGDLIDEARTVLVNLAGEEVLKPLNIKCLAEVEV